MNWFRRTDKMEEGRETKDEGRLRPSSLIRRPSLNYFLFRALRVCARALFAATLWLVPQVALASTNYTAVQTSDAAATTLLVLMTMGAMRKVGMFEAGFSGCAFSSRCGRAKGTLLEEKLNLWQQRIYKRPSVLSSIFILLFENCRAYSPKEHAYSKTKEKYPGVNFPGIGWNEITDNSACKNNIPYVNADPRNGLDLVVVQSNYHTNNIIHHLGCQGMLSISGART